ncbi:unnamed protein product, partial [Meganyctiphanes norvegica]
MTVSRNTELGYSLYSTYFLQKSMNQNIAMMVKEEIEVHKEPVLSENGEVLVKEELEFHGKQLVLRQDAEILAKEEMDVNEEPVLSHDDIPIKYEIDVNDKAVLAQEAEIEVKEIFEFQKKQIMIHMMTHTEEKPYHCNHCGKVLTNKYSFIRHQVTHTGDK